MPLPLILGAGAAVLGGLAAHGKAKEYNRRAESILEEAENMYYSKKRSLEETQQKTEESLLKLGYSKKEVLETSVKQFLNNYQKIKEVELKKSLGLNEIENFSIQNQEALELKEMSDIYESAFSKGATGAAAGAVIALAASGSLPVVTGVLSTAGGLAIAGNIGAAAGLAGSALSLATSLTPIAAIAAPAVLFTGISSVLKAEENLEKARASKRQAELAVEKMQTAETLCRGIIRNSEMFDELLNKLNVMFLHCNGLLTGVINRKTWIFNKKVKSSSLTEDELKLIAVTRALAGAVKAVIDTPILNQNGEISTEANSMYKETSEKLGNFASAVKKIQNSDIEKINKANKLNVKNTAFAILVIGLILGAVCFFIPKLNKATSKKNTNVEYSNPIKENVSNSDSVSDIEKVEKNNNVEYNVPIEKNVNELNKNFEKEEIKENINDEYNIPVEEKIDKTDNISTEEFLSKNITSEYNTSTEESIDRTNDISTEEIIKEEVSGEDDIIPIEESIDKINNNFNEEEIKNDINNENNINQTEQETDIKENKTKSNSSNHTNVKKKKNKYNGPERNQFIILNGKSVFIDSRGNILQ